MKAILSMLHADVNVNVKVNGEPKLLRVCVRERDREGEREQASVLCLIQCDQISLTLAKF